MPNSCKVVTTATQQNKFSDDDEKYIMEKKNKDFEQVQYYLTNKDKFEKIPFDEAPDCIFEKHPPPPVVGVYRVSQTVDAPAKFVRDFIWDLKNTEKLSSSLEVNEKLASFGQDQSTFVLYQLHSSPAWGVAQRDFVVLRSSIEQDNQGEIEYSVISSSVDIEHIMPNREKEKGYVRGNLVCSGYSFRPISENKCTVTYVIATDPKGWIPSWLTSSVQKKLPTGFVQVKSLVETAYKSK